MAMIPNAARFFGLAIALGASATSSTRAVCGEMGPRSQASIRISVSVAPRFEAATATMADQRAARRSDTPAGTRFASNAPDLRFSVLVFHAASDEAPNAGSDSRSDGNPGFLLVGGKPSLLAASSRPKFVLQGRGRADGRPAPDLRDGSAERILYLIVPD